MLKHYKFKNWIGITRTLLELLRSQIPILGLDLGKTSYKDIVFVRGEILSLVGAQNESLRLIIIFYFQTHIWDQNNFATVTSKPKNPFKGSI